MFNLNIDKIISDALVKILESKHFKKHIDDAITDSIVQARSHLEEAVSLALKTTVEQHRASVMGVPTPLTPEEKAILTQA